MDNWETMTMVQKTNKSHIHRKRVTKENYLTQEMVSRILMLHELGIPPEAIRLNLYETCHAEVPFRLIKGTTDKLDCLVEEWLNRLRRSIGEELVLRD
jgi:hypothetical protein